MTRSILIIMSLLIISSCKDNQVIEHISGRYYLRKTATQNTLNEPTYSILELIYKDPSTKKYILISKDIGMYNSTIDKNFSWKAYRNNIAYVKYMSIKGNTKFYLYVYVPRKGNILVDKNFLNYWKVTATDKGIRCLPYLDGEISENVTPIIYSAEYLSNLDTEAENQKGKEDKPKAE